MFMHLAVLGSLFLITSAACKHNFPKLLSIKNKKKLSKIEV